MFKHRRPRAVPLLVLFVLVRLTSSASAQVLSSGPTPQTKSSSPTVSNPLTLDEALRLADLQASTYQNAVLNERIAAEDVKQARAAFFPRLTAPLGYLYTSPAHGLPPGEPRAPSFIASDAI